MKTFIITVPDVVDFCQSLKNSFGPSDFRYWFNYSHKSYASNSQEISITFDSDSDAAMFIMKYSNAKMASNVGHIDFSTLTISGSA